MIKFQRDALLIKVALHELLGHGTGKLFIKNDTTGEANFNTERKNPLNGKDLTTYYKHNEGWY